MEELSDLRDGCHGDCELVIYVIVIIIDESEL